MGTISSKILGTKKPRPMHFSSPFAVGETICGKEASRTRCAYTLTVWDSPTLAGGRRCPECAPGVEAMRKASTDNAGA